MNTTRRTTFATFLALGAVIALSACSSNSVTAEQTKTSVTHAVAAIKLAESEAGGVAFALDAEGSRGWDIDVAANGEVFEVRISPDGTSVTSTRSDGRIDTDDRVRLEVATVALADAITTASGETSGLVTEAELDRFMASPTVWSVTFEDGTNDVEVAVDAITGKVVNVARD